MQMKNHFKVSNTVSIKAVVQSIDPFKSGPTTQLSCRLLKLKVIYAPRKDQLPQAIVKQDRAMPCYLYGIKYEV